MLLNRLQGTAARVEGWIMAHKLSMQVSRHITAPFTNQKDMSKLGKDQSELVADWLWTGCLCNWLQLVQQLIGN